MDPEPALTSSEKFPSTLAGRPAARPADFALFAIDGYEVRGVVGEGAFGVVYLAHDAGLDRLVAIKKLKAIGEPDDDEIRRFRSEGEILSNVRHPNIVQVHSVGVHEGAPYIVMEFIDGGTLAQRMASGPHRPREAAEVVETLARAIQGAHDELVVHRDLKPGNILRTKSGELKITDFGLAKRLDRAAGRTVTGAILGTPAYMAPEQAHGGRHVRPTADIYALGAILYELLAGRPPFVGDSVIDLIDQVRSAEPVPPGRLADVPRDLETICLKCLCKEPRGRYKSAEALADDLRSYLDDREIVARPATRRERLLRYVRRHPGHALTVGLSITTAAMAVLIGVLLYVQHKNSVIAGLQQEVEAAREKATREAYEESADALDGIMALVREGGSLRRSLAVDPLQTELLRYYSKLIDRQKDNPNAQRDKLAQACYHLAELSCDASKFDDALGALQVAERLLPPQADAAAARRRDLALGRVLVLRGRLLQMFGRKPPAGEAFAAARSLLEPFRKGDPAARRLLADALHWSAYFEAELIQFDAARRHYGEAIALLESLVGEDKNDRVSRRELARTLADLGELLLNAGDARGAEERLRRSLALREDVQGDEELFQLAVGREQLARFQARQRQRPAAIESFRMSRRLYLDLFQKNPFLVEPRWAVAVVNNAIAELLLLDAPSAEARREAGELLRAADELFAPSYWEGISPSNWVAIVSAETAALRARLALIEGRPADARGTLDAATKRVRFALASRGDLAEPHYQLAAVLAMEAELGAGVSADLAVAELAKARKLGFLRLAAEDIEADRAFRACKDRPDFRQASREKRGQAAPTR